MPTSPKGPCSTMGCPHLAHARGRCRLHYCEYLLWAGEQKALYNSPAWQALRLSTITAQGGVCATPGCTAAALDLHHKLPLREAPELALVPSNLEAHCHSCHSRLTGKGG